MDARLRDRARTLLPLVLGIGTFLLFSRVAGHAFLHYDDNVYVTENPRVLQGLSLGGVVWAFTDPDAWYGYPLSWLSHMLDVQLFGLRAGAHLLVNALLHAVNAVLVYRVLARLTGSSGRSAAVAVLFAVHPLHVEAVAWLSERKELLSASFGLLALHAYARYAERAGARRYAVVGVLFAASLLAKPMWVTLPFLLLLLDVWPLRRTGGIGRLAIEKLPLLALSLAASIVTMVAQGHGGALRGLDLTVGARLAYVPVSYVLYLWKTFWPRALSAYYPHPGSSLPLWQAAGAAVALGAITALAVHQRKARPWLPLGWLWFAGMLVPVIGVVKAGGHGIADRNMYAPSIGLFLALVWGLAELAERLDARRAAQVLAGILVAILAALTWRQIGYWSDQVTLFTHAVEVTERNGMAHHILSQGLLAEGRDAEALLHAREAARLEPGNARVRKNLGYAYYRMGLVDEAIAELRAAIAIDPDYAEAHGNLGIAYGRKGRFEEAAREMGLERRLRASVRPER
jgi:tetratricopeptide (TPR) repeat protein